MDSSSFSPTEKVVIAGGSGFLGMNLAKFLENQQCDVVLLSRSRPQGTGHWTHATWDGRTPGEWVTHLNGATALVNLTGRTVDCIKTPDHCDEILRSRVESTMVLGQALKLVEQPPKVWVQMSTAHIHGDPPELICDEESAIGYGLAPTVARAWEAAYAQSVLPEMRQVILRTSFVIGSDGGALQRLAFLVRMGFGGKVGHGRQGISWIHEHDMNRLFWRGISDESMQGIYLATAPNPVSNAEFMRALRKALKMPIGLPAYEWMVRIGAPLVMKTDPELGLYGRYCISKRLKEEGFTFEHADVESALRDLYGK
nr:DUF1731 domain-containing protein [Rubinisphaera sp.]